MLHWKTNIVWALAYKKIIDWMPSTLIDLNLINNMMQLEVDKLKIRDDIIDKAAYSLGLFNPKNRRFTAIYRRRGKPQDESVPYEVNPLGLMFTVYLLVTLWNYQDIKQLAMHRFQEAALMDKPVLIPKDFKLDDYIAEGGFDYLTEPERNIRLSLKIQPWLNKQLTDTPLSANQIITPIDESIFQLQATVKDTRQLRWWLKSLGADVEILETQSLREEFAENAKALSQIYQ
jgi:predicted DNA-binding transcriptional regulator YafY